MRWWEGAFDEDDADGVNRAAIGYDHLHPYRQCLPRVQIPSTPSPLVCHKIASLIFYNFLLLEDLLGGEEEMRDL